MKGKGTGALGKAKKEGAGSSVEESGNQLIADTRHREGGIVTILEGGEGV